MSDGLGTGRRGAGRRGTGWRGAALLAAVAVAFADSSIVVLALPDLRAEFEAGIPAVSWVVTGYNLAVAVAAALAVPLVRRSGSRAALLLGLIVFLAASLACVGAPGLGPLVAFRIAQGLGAGVLLAAALSVLTGLVGRRGRAGWTLAATVGTAVGPALGGLLTEAFDWRTVFLAQAPLAAAALGALATSPVRTGDAPEELDGPGVRAAERSASPARRFAADAVLALASGALVGALFLVVVLLVDGWQVRPVVAALVATVLPLAAVAAAPLADRLTRGGAVAIGLVLLALGLAGLALLTSTRLPPVTGWLAACGAGLGLVLPAVTREGLRGADLALGAGRSVAVRHAGLVAALLLVTPLLTTGLDRAGEAATLGSTAAVLDAPVDVRTKVSVAGDLADAATAARQGRVPDLDRVLASQRDPGRPALRDLGRALDRRIEAAVTRGFRGAFLACAVLALLGPLALAGLRGGRPAEPVEGPERVPPRQRRRAGSAAARAAAAGLVALATLGLVLELGGAGSFGTAPQRDPCRPPAPRGGGSFDAAVQRVLDTTLDDAACRLGTTRERLALTLAPDRGQPRLDLPARRLDPAVRKGLDSALDREVQRGTIPAGVAGLARQLAAGASAADLVSLLGQLGTLGG